MSLRAIGPALALTVVVAACAETTVESPETTAAPVTTGATVADPLDALAAEVAALSAALIDNDGQREALARIEELWSEVRTEIAGERPELVDGFEAIIGQLRRAVDRRRPADADKAYKNLLTLVNAYQG